jgi:thiamine biosynthesis lipoprotein
MVRRAVFTAPTLRNALGLVACALCAAAAFGFAARPPGQSAGAEPAKRFEFVEPHMGTRFRIVLYAADEGAARRAAEAAFARIARLNAILSDYQDDSELMRLCRQAGGPPVRVSDELFFVLRRSQDLARRTDGAFDVTVGPLSRLWRRSKRQKELPGPERLAAARRLVGRDLLVLDESEQTVQLKKPGMLLDVGGIAKGYAADEAQKVLRARGVTRALVAAGGDIAVSEPPPGEAGWTVGIAPLEHPDRPPTRHVLLANAAVSTSGDAEQFVEIGGRRYAHILDPKTGLGLTTRLSVTVVAREGIDSDSLATAVAVLGPEQGLKLIEATPGAAALVLWTTPEVVKEYESPGWRKYVAAPRTKRGG